MQEPSRIYFHPGYAEDRHRGYQSARRLSLLQRIMRSTPREFGRRERCRYWLKRGRRNASAEIPKPTEPPVLKTNQQHAKILSKFDDFRHSEQFCDGVLVSNEGKNYKIHRILLASNSDYFRAAFGSPLSSSDTLVRLDFPTDVVDRLVDYCYTQSCDITEHNVQQLLVAADQVGLVGLVESCCAFLKEHTTLNNAYGIYRFASLYGCNTLGHSLLNFLLAEFVSFAKQTNEFQEMLVDDLAKLLRSDRLNVPDETVVWQAICRWMEANIENANFVNKLWPCVRFGLLDPEYFRLHVLSAPFIEAVSSNNLWSARNAIISEDVYCKARIPYQIVFAIGGWSAGHPTNSMENYDIRANRWYTSQEYGITERAYHGLVSVDNKIYLIGGFDGTNHFNLVYCFDPIKKKWTEKACMHWPRCYVSCVVVNKDIYAIGGYNNADRMKTVERYSVADNQWYYAKSMIGSRSDCGAVAVGTKIYVTGGFNGHEVLDTTECYDTETNTWHALPNMNTRRSGVCLVYFRGYIYALGGFNGGMRLGTVERLNVSRPIEWQTDVPNMITQRSNFASIVLDDKIYVMGGFNGVSTISCCECFDGDSWQVIASMNKCRSALSVCVCEGLENAEEYTNRSFSRSKKHKATQI